jgi:hypothetical protein
MTLILKLPGCQQLVTPSASRSDRAVFPKMFEHHTKIVIKICVVERGSPNTPEFSCLFS